MEHELWAGVVQAVRAAAACHRERQRKFDDASIILTLLWAVLNDRPVLWATDCRNWPFYLRVKSRPSPATMSRRLRSPSVLALLERVRARVVSAPDPSVSLIIDAKPLPVGGYTNDRDARTGRACGCFARGYKLYLIIDEKSGIHAWKVESMNAAEQIVAEELIPAAARSAGPDRWLLGDKAYDSNRLYALADEHGLRLLAPRLKPGTGMRPNQTPGRLRAASMLEPPISPQGRSLQKRREAIERYLGTLCCTGGGLTPLPGYVRGLKRVRCWVGAKLLIRAVRLRTRTALAA